MFGSQIVDIAIGMIFVYLLLSLICSALNEIIEAKLKNRAKNLETGIRNLLGNDQLANAFYNHGLVGGLFKDKKPSYIPSRTFALTLMNIVAPDIAPDGINPVQSFRNTVSKIPPNSPAAPIKEALMALANDAQGDINKLRANVEDWYDDTMDRVSGWYKRRVHTIIVFLGLGIAIALNADSAYIVRNLANDLALRTSLVSSAQAFAQKDTSAQPKPDSSPANPASPASGVSPTGANTTATNPASSPTGPGEAFQSDLNEIKKLGLPMGWSLETNDVHLKWPGVRIWQPGIASLWLQQIRFHWLGWILTALAISLGAPFWFDMLNKFIVVRSTVKPKEKSQEEHSKD